MNLELSSENIRAEIEQIGSRLLFSSSLEKLEKNVLELVALYPHPDVYRTAMRFFRLRENTEKLRSFGWELLELLPTDQEAQQILAESYLSERKLDKQDKKKAVRVIDSLWQREELNSEQAVRYADILEDIEEYSKRMSEKSKMSCPTEQQPSVASPTITENWDSSLHFVTLRMTKYTVQKLFRHPLKVLMLFFLCVMIKNLMTISKSKQN
ncbi:hypothetical protein [Nostoc sp.]|uniref:hypothetical protein n=1 Tax=Nostoc sp. TaxID=1180 RepID=UPI002FFADCC9